MKVVYAVSVTRGGPLTHVIELAREVSRCGVDVEVVCASEEAATQLRQNDVVTHVVPLRDKLDIRGAARVRALLGGADVVHTHDRRTGLLVRPQARSVRAAPVHTLHGLPNEIFGRIGPSPTPDEPTASRARIAWLVHGLLRIEALLSRIGSVVVPSRALADFLITHGFRSGNMAVIPNGINVSTAPRATASEGRTVVGTSAVLEHRKGVDVLLEATAGLSDDVTVRVFGDGPQRRALEDTASKLGIDAHFYGYVDDARQRIAELDVFVLPTRADNFPMAILEAMAAGVPVVATRVGGIPEIITDGETGLLVPPDDPSALREAIEQLVAQPELRKRLGANGFDRVRTEFGADVIARRMVDLYANLCASST